MKPEIEVRNQSATSLLADLDTGCADLIIADYPFDHDGELVAETVVEFERVLKQHGNLAVINNPFNLYEHAAEFANRFDIRNEVVLVEGDPLYPNNHLGFSHNTLWLLHNGDPSHFNGPGDNRVGLTDVWDDGPTTYNSGYFCGDIHHPGAVPEWVMRRIIKLCTEPGDQVVDPFVGAGTSAVVSMKTNRHLIGGDIDENWVELTEVRLSDLSGRLDWYGEGDQEVSSGD